MTCSFGLTDGSCSETQSPGAKGSADGVRGVQVLRALRAGENCVFVLVYRRICAVHELLTKGCTRARWCIDVVGGWKELLCVVDFREESRFLIDAFSWLKA